MYESMALSLDDEAFRVDMEGTNDVGSYDVSHSRPPHSGKGIKTLKPTLVFK